MTPVIQKNGFAFSGLAGVQVEADMAQTTQFMPTIGDGDLTALTKVKANYVAPGGKTEIYFNPSADFSVGLHDINAIYDRDKSLAKNVKMTPNAIRADAGVKSKIPDSNLTMTNNASYTTTNLGSLVGVTSSISGNGGTAFITYQRPTRAMSGGRINVLPASTERLGAGYEGSPLKKHKELKTKAAAGYDFTQKSPYAQGAIQYTIPKKKKKPVVNE